MSSKREEKVSAQEIFQKLEKTHLLVGYFPYPECNVCQVLRPKVEQLVKQYEDFEFLYVDIHQYPEVSGQLLVFSVPTVIVFADGKEVKRLSRHFSIGELESVLDRLEEVYQM